MTKDEALKLALEALESCDQVYGSEGSYQYFSQAKVDKAITAIKQALAAPVQEPVAWREFDGEGGYTYFAYQDNETWRDEYIERNGEKYANWVEPLYTASSTSHLHLLSDEFIYKVVRSSQPHLDDDCADWRRHFAECKYWLEIAHGITPPPAAQQERTDYAVHLNHCNIGECEGVCKYLDDDCPALKHADMKAKWDRPTPPAQPAPVQPVQEPVAWMHEWDDGERIPMLRKREVDSSDNDSPKSVRPLVYGDTTPPAAQRQWVGLTDEERNKLWRDVVKWGDPSHDDVDLIKAIEAKLKEKNT
jgi:hypothetical protein